MSCGLNGISSKCSRTGVVLSDDHVQDTVGDGLVEVISEGGEELSELVATEQRLGRLISNLVRESRHEHTRGFPVKSTYSKYGRLTKSLGNGQRILLRLSDKTLKFPQLC